MKNRVFAAAAASLLVVSFILAAGVSADNKKPVKRGAKVKANPLVAMLPASDAVATIDSKRFFNEALPGVLSANQKLLGEIFSQIESVETKTGVDLRRFDNIAAGINITRKDGARYDFDPILIARGSIDAAAALEAGKRSSNARSREEMTGGKRVYIFSAKDVAADLKPSVVPGALDSHLNRDIAVSAIDATTIVVGSPARVRETLGRKTTISPELTLLLGKKTPGLLNFAGKIPGGLSALLPLDNDELGANLDSIKTIYGNADVVAGQATISVTGRTVQAKQAADLKGTFEGLRDLGKGILGASRAADKQLYARLLGSIRITNVANELSLDLTIPKTDLDELLAIVSK